VPEKDSLSALSDSALAEVKGKWIVFDRTVKLNDSVSLGQKIDLFAEPLSDFFQTKYPTLLSGGSQVFWLTIFTAVIESDTHPKAAVNDAIAELRGKYAGKP
jgi:acyl-ACP thioesterase